MNGAVLIRGRHVLTSAAPESVTDGAVRLSAGRITHVGAYRELAARFPTTPCTAARTTSSRPGS